jgi:superfamily II DNA or RNA helicase
MLLKLLDGVSSWAELESRISALPAENERGEAFEEFCKPFFLLDPVFQFKEVYRHNEIPPSLRDRLGYPGVQDVGIDGLAVTADGKLFAYQAKFRKNPDNTPTLRELSTFFTMSDKADWRITITNAKKLPPSINDRTRNSRILIDRLDGLTPDFFERLRAYLKEQSVTPQEKKIPNKTQQEAINSALGYFRENKRGQLILPCGTGKTLVSMWIAEQLRGRRILVMVPSLALMSQSLREWAANTSICPFNYLCLCSDTTVDLANDSPVEHLYEMDIPVTTDAETVANFLRKTSSDTSILFSTYQSSKVLSEASVRANVTFDIGIFDEAHRTTGTKAGVWSIALDDKKVPVEKRIFMTATPRIYAPHITKRAEENDVLICSMDDAAVYGKPFYEMTFGEAIARGHITDYKIVVICVTDAEVRNLIRQSGRVVTDDGHEWDAKALAKRVALVKGINAYGLKKIFTFHSRVQGAKAFTDTKIPYGIHQIFKMLSPDVKNDGTGFFHVNGTMSAGERNGYMREFKKAELGIMSNARCLNEGVDVPAVDTVAFIDPKKSLIDIVQATGRAMRNAEWKKTGYVFIPVVVEDSPDPEKFIESSDFDAVYQVLQAMMDQDQRLEDIVSNLRVMQGKGEEGTQAWKDAMAEYGEKVEVYNLPTRINQTRFFNTLQTRTLEVIGKKWDFWYGLTIKYKEEFGDANAPKIYKTYEGYNLGTWQNEQKKNYKNGTLAPERVGRLEKVGFKWAQSIEDAFEKGFQETLRYKEQSGDANAPASYTTPDRYTLGSWQSWQRQHYKSGKLDTERIKRLEDIGFNWNLLEGAFEKGFQETLRYKEQTGDANAPTLYKTPDGYNLGSWQSRQRRNYKDGKLDTERITRLEKIGFKWVLLEEAFEKGFQETLRYKKQTGHANARGVYTTPDGYRLGAWQNSQRQYYKNGKLNTERIKRLVEIGFKWDQFEDDFKKGFQETIKYKEQTGEPNAPNRYSTQDGYNLGNWQQTQRQSYKNGKMDTDKAKRLEEIGFKWVPLEDAFEKGFQETLRYKKQTGDPNAPQRYKTPDGYKLGSWQSNQRNYYKNGKLDNERLRRLEKMGFKWVPLEDAFEKGFQETLRYKEQTGNANARRNYKTPDGYYLGRWQSHQRENYKNGKLVTDRIKKLEEIGFKWIIKKGPI